MATLRQGASKILNIPIIEEGSALNVSTSTSIICCLYNGKTKTEVAKYSLNPQAGFGTLTVNADTVSIDVEIEDVDSTGFPVGQIIASIKGKMTDISMTDGDRTFVMESNAILTILPGIDLEHLP